MSVRVTNEKLIEFYRNSVNHPFELKAAMARRFWDRFLATSNGFIEQNIDEARTVFDAILDDELLDGVEAKYALRTQETDDSGHFRYVSFYNGMLSIYAKKELASYFTQTEWDNLLAETSYLHSEDFVKEGI